jgi:putative heme-binding domain-containing protein
VRQYRDILQWQAEPRRGRDLFLKHCAQCHQRDGQGVAVGPNLDDARGKSPQQLLEDILDPNAAVTPNHSTYVVETHNGQTYTGILISESETRIVLMRAEGARDEIPRERIAEIRATSLSLMPENLEQTLSKQDLADIIAYLRQP